MRTQNLLQNLQQKTNVWLKSVLWVVCCCISGNMYGQAPLPFFYDDGKPSSVLGLTHSGLGSDYDISPKMKFDHENDNLILNFSGTPGILSFNIRWNRGATAPPRFPGTFTLGESDNGLSYTEVQTYDSVTGTALKNLTIVTEVITMLKSTTRYVKWEYTAKTNGNIGLGNIMLRAIGSVNTIQYSINGTVSTEKSIVGEGFPIGDFPITPLSSDCDYRKVFAGWTEQVISEITDSPPPLITENYIPAENKTLFAVFANVSENEEWRAINDVSEITAGTYVITFENSGKPGVYYYLPSESLFKDNPEALTGLAIANDKLTNPVISKMQWDFQGNNTDEFTVSHTQGNNNYFLTSTDTAQGISVTSEATVTWKAIYNSAKGILLKGSDEGNRYLAVFISTQDQASWRYYNAGADYKGKLTLYKKHLLLSDFVTDCATLVWNGNTSMDWNTAENWKPIQQPDNEIDVVIPVTLVDGAFRPVLSGNKTDNQAKDVYFKPGAEIGRQDLLTFNNAFVELDLTPCRWHLLAMPVVATAGDFYFENGPNSWIRKFITTAGNENNQAGWKYVTSLDESFGIGDGFAFWVAGSENQKITLKGNALAGASKSEDLDFGADSDSYFALAGNPFMTTIDFDELQKTNTSINSSYLIWTGAGFSGYSKTGAFGAVVTNSNLNAFIAPLQSFIVEKADNTSSTLNFNLADIQATGSGELKSDENTGNKLDIIASNPTASVLTFIANREDGQSSRKLFSTRNNVPDIYTLNGATALGANIIRTNDILVPVGLSTTYTGNMSLTFNGMARYDAQISFVDVVANREIDITGLNTYEYTFDYAAEENRFFVRIQSSPTGLNNPAANEITVYSKDKTIFAISGSSDLIRKIRIYNMQGVLVYADENVNAPSCTVNCNGTVPEICVVKLITERGMKSVKVISGEL